MVYLTNLKTAIFLAARVDGNKGAEHVGKQTAIFVPVAEKEEEESGNYGFEHSICLVGCQTHLDMLKEINL